MFRLILVPLTLAVAACGGAADGQAEPDTKTNTSPAAAEANGNPATSSRILVEVAPTSMIHAEPASLPDCRGAIVTLNWDVGEVKPGLTSVKIYTGGGQLFTHQGGFGSVETGPWVTPGSVFVLKRGDDDSELERLTIGGPACSQP